MFRRSALVILALLLAAIAAAVVAAIRIDRQMDGRHMRVLSDMHALGVQLEVYHTMRGSFPTTEQGLRALIEKPTNSAASRQGPQYLLEIPRDPWGSEYTYRCPGKKHPDAYDLFSAERDRKQDTTDDDWGRDTVHDLTNR